MTQTIEVINPWASYNNWHDIRKSMDDSSTDLLKASDVEVLYQAMEGDEWDGTVVFVGKFSDGRYIAYETSYGPTGHGFCEDAYGGDAEVWFGKDLNKLLLQALSDQGRRMIGIPAEGSETNNGED